MEVFFPEESVAQEGRSTDIDKKLQQSLTNFSMLKPTGQQTHDVHIPSNLSLRASFLNMDNQDHQRVRESFQHEKERPKQRSMKN